MAQAEALISSIITEFKKYGWQFDLMQPALQLATDHPNAIVDFTLAVMRELPEGGTFLDATLSFLPMQDWPRLVQVVVNTLLEQPNNEAAIAVLLYASLQSPSTVHPHLKEIFQIAGDSGSYWYEPYAFREAKDVDVAFLFEHLMSADEAIVRRVCIDLLETRLPTASAAVQEYASEHLDYLPETGFEPADQGVRQLYSPNPLHFVFPADYFNFEPTYAHQINWRQMHPTWKISQDAAFTHRFGGVGSITCAVCGKQTQHMVTLDPVPQNVRITMVKRLQLEVCLACLGMERDQLHYQHDAQGKPQNINGQEVYVEPEFPAHPFEETQIALVEHGARWHWQEWGAANDRENLHRFGGHPSWVQDAEYPSCSLCEQTSTFLMQLDGDMPTIDSREWLWGSGGLCYIFWCDSCRVSSFLWQCT